jgi:hypothetical protein
VYFAVMILHKKQTLWVALAFVFTFSACNGKKQVDTESSKDSMAAINDSIPKVGEPLRGSDSGIVVMETKRAETTLLGVWHQLPVKGIREAIKTNATLIVAEIVSRKVSMEGGLTLVYRNMPSEGTQEVFIGIPIGGNKHLVRKMAESNTGGNPSDKQMFTTVTLPAATYLKATVNAEPGLTSKSWLQFKSLMLNRKQCIASDFESKENANAKMGQVDLSKVAKTFPYMEYYTDSRNLEMATTVAQAILLMRKP